MDFRECSQMLRKSFAYLWIDSLCIIQEGDAGADWRHQATLMGKIYQNALCTIAVHAISDPDESFSKGIFRERNVGLVTPFASAASIAKADNTYLPVSNYYLIPEYDWAAGVARSPLSRRGWVIQERHLSQRILHFTEDQIFFECYETVQTEGWPGGHPVQSIGRIQRITTDLQALILHRADKIRYADQAAITQKLLDDPLVAWYRMAYTYAGTDLTFPTDKLIAISGLARAMAPFVSASPADYLAGVWVRSLPYGLLWGTSLVDRPEGKPIRPRPPAPYQGPSWSWASINWPATYHHQLHAQPHEKLVAFEGYEVKPKVDPGTGIADPYGEVEPGAWIKVRGTTYGIKLKWKTAKTNTKNSTFFMAEVWTGTGKWPTQNGQSPTVFPDERYIEGETSESRSDLRVMPMLRSSKESTSKWIEMLILEPTGNPSEYRRFGIMEAWGQMGRQWFEWHTGNFIGKNISGKREETITLV
ncbi:hypothetical protein H2198_003746 [Neophaeococcomyces mojaviensis]|uniref:Uncharacterized protein n=1 Tax=Neophaeococcomyces mojaviensis TaxID=3383035 RepID=A0ACC3AAG9_9EURO|nr:hypothetical protein H2198_003746 [Knufia sp. JES_112]